MFVQYGSFKHPPAFVQYNYRLDPILNEAEFAISQKAHVDLDVWLLSHKTNTLDAQADLAAQFTALQAAYAVSGKDLLLVQDNGQQSPLSLINSKALGGVRVIQQPAVPQNSGASGATYFRCTITLEAEFPFSVAAGSLWSFHESLDFRGFGGPRIGALEPLIGTPIIQTLRQQTPVFITQSGEVVGYLAAPSLPSPAFPALLNSPECTLGKVSARAIGRGKDRDFKLFARRYSYAMISPVPITGEPNEWTTG